MPECQAFEEVLVARSAEEFSRSLDIARARAQDPQHQALLRSRGLENSWTSRVKLVLEHLK
jgi:hypothetical protein